jgi:hypothetical protein
MKLQDVIHYYIGCNLGTHEMKIGKLIGIDKKEPHSTYYVKEFRHGCVEKADDLHWNSDLGNLRPILRRLEDMTEEEAKFILENYSFCSVDMPMNKKKFAIEIAKRLVNQIPVAHYLLTQHFDLFNLIDAGLAVDQKTITQ